MGDREPDGLDSAGMKGKTGFSFSFLRIGCMTFGFDTGI